MSARGSAEVETASSPRIEALKRELEAGRPEAINEFWREVDRAGAPLVEPTGNDGEVIVSFLWRDRAGETESVRVVGGPAPWYGSPGHALQRVASTELWCRSYRLRSELRGLYRFLVNEGVDDPERTTGQELFERLQAGAGPDPLNPNEHVWRANPTDRESRDERWSILELPAAPPQPWYAPRDGMPTGTIERLTVASGALGNERNVWVYTPASGRGGTPGLVVLFDGWIWVAGMPIAPTFDNLMAEGRIPPLAVVMVDYLDQTARMRELTCHRPFLAFLEEELLPLVRGRRRITDDPGRTIVAGQSLGGLTAAYAGLELPHVFGNVLSQAGVLPRSGEQWWSEHPTAWGAEYELPDDREWLTRRFAEGPRLPLRFYLDIGLLELPQRMLGPNRRLRNVLRAKGYDVTYQEFYGSHDYLCWRGTLADGLVALTSAWR